MTAGNTITDPKSVSAAVSTQPADGAQPEEKRHILPAEKWFNRGVYGGVNYLIQVSASVAFTMWAKYGGGKVHFEKAAQWMGKNIIPKITNKHGLEAVHESNTYLIATALITVGNLFLLPVKWFEDRKPEHVRKIDDLLVKNYEEKYGPLGPEEKAKREDAHEALAAEPKQSWWSLLGARAGALATVYTAIWAVGEKNNAAMQKKAGDVLEHVFKNSGISKLEKIAHSPGTRNFAQIAFVDFFYSIVVASSLFAYSKLLSKKPAPQPVVSAAKAADEPAIAQPETAAASSDFTKRTMSTRSAPAPHGAFVDYAKKSELEPQVAL